MEFRNNLFANIASLLSEVNTFTIPVIFRYTIVRSNQYLASQQFGHDLLICVNEYKYACKYFGKKNNITIFLNGTQ